MVRNKAPIPGELGGAALGFSFVDVGRFFLQVFGVPDEEISDADALLVGVLLLMALLGVLTLLVNLTNTPS